MYPVRIDLDAFGALTVFCRFNVRDRLQMGTSFIVCHMAHSCRTWWTNEIAIDPSPTADATRLMLPPRTSPTANTPGKLVSSKYGGRIRGQPAAPRSSGKRS